MQVFLSCCLEWSNELINCIKGIHLLIRTYKSSDPLGEFVIANSFVDDQGHVSEYGLCMKLEACGHDVVVSKMVDTYSKLCDHDVVKKLNNITSLEFLSGPSSPLSRDESPLLYAAVITDNSLGRGESATELIVVFPLCDWDCSNGEGPRNSTVGRNLKVFLVLIHYIHCAVNVVMKPILWMIGNYGA
ncbi:hypothetical protein A2U01_0014336 [Trifolium medium]|uniref:Uncharacterized protein n=1 Tax=Trifolium medium TaxID=97028 RepID=A0A392N0S3_9FABA|nr:hypothetical protein [Trifolium medium]